MALVINNNISSLVAQDNLSRNSASLSTTLQRLSSGLKINSGADGPAALVISEEQKAQIAGLQTAIDNSSKAVSLVQTAEGALSTVNDLLTQIRGLALDSANSAVNDSNALAANQAQVANALATIDRIANNTQFGTKKILDGSAGLTGTANNSAVTFLNATTSAPTGTFAVNVTTAAQTAVVKAGTAQTGNLAQDETLTINGVSVALTSGETRGQVQDSINQYTGQTGVVADNYQTTLTDSTGYTRTASGAAQATDKLTALTANTAAYVAGDKIDVSGTDANGAAVSGQITTTQAGNFTVQNLLDGINSIFQHATASIDASGKIVLTAKANDPLANSQNFSLTLADHAGNTGATAFTALDTYGGDTTRLRSVQSGSAASITVQSNVAASATSSGLGTSQITAQGVDVAGTIGGFAAVGNGNVLTGTTGEGAQGISLAIGGATANPTASTTGALGNVTINNQSLVFQIGANANQTASVAVNSVKTSALGLNVAGNQFANLGQIDIRSQSGAQDAIKVIDQAISDVSDQRGQLGAFQAQTLQSGSNNLQTTLENTTSAESVITDTNFAAETANLSKYQVLTQAGASVLYTANQTSQLIITLLRG